MSERGKLIVVSGLSAAGKGTITRELVKRYDDYVLSISATTRERRGVEVDGVDYFFVTKDKFEEMIKNNELLEYAKYVDNYYGTPKKYVMNNLDNGKNVVLEIEMQGALQIKKIFDEAILIFLLPKDAKTQRERLVKRGRESEIQIRERLKQTIIDSEYAKYYDYIMINTDIDLSINDVKDIVEGNYDKEKNEFALQKLTKLVKDIKEENYV